MDPLLLARWQFGITTVYHFLFVPLTISLAFTVAGFQTAWYRSGNEKYLRLTRFFGKLFLINFAIGVVTGIVQEFQFGMNWSDYSRFVGDIFGAPARDRGPPRLLPRVDVPGPLDLRLGPPLEAGSTWPRSGSPRSAPCSRPTSSWPRTPGCSTRSGYTFNEAAGRAELTDIVAVLTSTVALVTFAHTIPAAFMTGGAFVAGIAMWRLLRHPDTDRPAYRTAAKVGAWMLVVSGLLVIVTGDVQARIMTDVQPMKMAVAEALWETSQPACVLALHDRHARRDGGDLLDPDPVSPVVHGHRRSQRQGRGDQRPPGPVRAAVRAG